ncbi:AMP-binding protein [Umezawaea endophytica]|uniref:AMP-binding protein n=1 Tax=Umezawaea endophytica TaxID=1654476 RepID=A0A9X3AEE9_9PSEU|nr:AMP-binding protein [Umezawaea endophytica]MCS7475815.1 AMP-binding protein [Umezawaea endophytica]
MSDTARHSEILDPGTPFVTAVRRLAEESPDVVALTDDRGSLTRGELDRRSNRLARAYAALGVGEGAFVTVGLPSGSAFIEAVLAVWKLGATPQPVSSRLPARELAAIVDVVRPALVVGLDAGAGAPSVPVGFEPDAALDDGPLPLLVSRWWKAPTSGGSTGVPKVIVGDQPATADALVPLMPLVRMRPGSTVLVATPLGHNAGFLWATAGLITGGHVVVMPRFDAERALDLIGRHRVEWACLVPTELHRVARLPERVRAAADLSSLAVVATGAAPCPPWLRTFWIDWIGADRLLEFYAATEGQAIVITDGHGWLSHPGSVGRVLVGEIEVRDEDGAVVPDGTVGELWMRRTAEKSGPYFYLGASPHRDERNFETVGDLGSMRDGWLYLADRKADMVVVGGANVYPAEVESAIEEHPLVVSSCVVGVPDDEYGSVLHAIVQVSAPVSDEELVAHVRERLVRYKVPRTFERTAEPLRDDAGKVRRALLRDRVLAERATTTAERRQIP